MGSGAEPHPKNISFAQIPLLFPVQIGGLTPCGYTIGIGTCDVK